MSESKLIEYNGLDDFIEKAKKKTMSSEGRLETGSFFLP